MTKTTLYDNVVEITYSYLGPAAERFVGRQIRNHLGKNPENLQHKDLKKLIVWIRSAMSLLSSDKTVIDQYINDLQNLATAER